MRAHPPRAALRRPTGRWAHTDHRGAGDWSLALLPRHCRRCHHRYHHRRRRRYHRHRCRADRHWQCLRNCRSALQIPEPVLTLYLVEHCQWLIGRRRASWPRTSRCSRRQLLQQWCHPLEPNQVRFRSSRKLWCIPSNSARTLMRQRGACRR